MSTRATYRFDPEPNRAGDGARWTPRPTFYIHHDGYEQGAATYFYAMLTHDNRRGSLADAFIRANDGAELTGGHEAHGDTEYRYDIIGRGNDAKLEVRAVCNRSWEHPERETWRLVFTGSLFDFIHRHHDMIENYSQFRMVQLATFGEATMMNATTAAQRLNSEYGPLHHLRCWDRPNGPCPHWSANWQSCVESLVAIVAAFPELGTEETRKYAATLGARHPDAVTV